MVAANLVYAQAASYKRFDRLTSVLVFLAILAFVIRYVMFFLVNTAVGKHRTNYHFNRALVTCLTAFVLFLHNAIPGTSFINSIRDYVLVDCNASSTGFRVFWADYLWCLIYGLSASTLTYLKTLIQYSSGQAKPQKPIRTFFRFLAMIFISATALWLLIDKLDDIAGRSSMISSMRKSQSNIGDLIK